jgi:hypothetical protein
MIALQVAILEKLRQLQPFLSNFSRRDYGNRLRDIIRVLQYMLEQK